MVRTIVAVLATVVLTVATVFVWIVALVLIESSFNKNVNEASVAGYGRLCSGLAIPVALVTGVVIAPVLNSIASKASLRKSRTLIYTTILFWSVYVAFHALGDYGFHVGFLPVELLEYFVLTLFLTPPVFVGCCMYIAIAGRTLIADVGK